MDEFIRTLAEFGRPFPSELRELYFQVEKHPTRHAALINLQRAARMLLKANRSTGTRGS
jgi:hypothetical protein